MKRIIFIILTILLLFVIGNMISSLYTLYHKKDLLVQTQYKLQQVQKQHTELQKQLQIVKTSQFIEQEARDKLFLVKKGESTVILGTTSSGTLSKQKQAQEPNWQQWWDLFF